MAAPTNPYTVYGADARALAAIGRRVLSHPEAVATVLPLELATVATTAWNRTGSSVVPANETPSQWQLRNFAGSLALIGMAIEAVGYVVDDHMTVVLPEDLKQEAAKAARELADRPRK